MTRGRIVTEPDHRSDRYPVTGLPRGSCFIYFFGTEDGAEIKVGHTLRHPSVRKADHEHNNGRYEPLRWLAVLIGAKSDESNLKSYFKAHTSRARSDEWIIAGEEMRGYLRFLRDLPYVASSEDVDLTTLERVDSLHWLPDGARRKSPSQLEIPLSDDPWADLATNVVMEGDFYTHVSITAAARQAMGGIDLDPASCAEANRGVQATRFFGAKENGLVHDWWGRVWINPPFGSWREEWTPKLIHEWESERVEQICALASTRTITAQGFHPIVRKADALWIGYGRLRFWGPKAGEPDEGHVVFYFGARGEEFRDAFEASGLGTVYGKAQMRMAA